jgi:hypothetical protein
VLYLTVLFILDFPIVFLPARKAKPCPIQTCGNMMLKRRAQSLSVKKIDQKLIGFGLTTMQGIPEAFY